MEVAPVSYAVAFLAGGLSFLSPCVLPLIPGYMAFLSGRTLEELTGQAASPTVTRRLLIRAVAFSAGFTIVFTLLGASASVVGQWLAQSHPWLSKIAGILIIVFGVHLTGLVRIPFLTYTRQFQTHRLSSGLGGALLLGMAFAFGWTPCIGPILASILTLAATQDTIWHGVELLLIYSLGLGVPFVLVAAALGPCLRWLAHYKRFVRAGEIAAGLLLITVGSLIATNRLTGLLRFIPETFFQFAK